MRSRRRSASSFPAAGPRPPRPRWSRAPTALFARLHSLVIHERLASNARNAITTTYRVAAPDKLAYSIANGPKAVIIGGTRWDKLPGGKWERSETEPIRQPEPFWGPDPRTNAHLLGTGTVGGRPVRIASFYDPHLPAWFVLSIEPGTGAPARAAHDRAGALHAAPLRGLRRADQDRPADRNTALTEALPSLNMAGSITAVVGRTRILAGAGLLAAAAARRRVRARRRRRARRPWSDDDHVREIQASASPRVLVASAAASRSRSTTSTAAPPPGSCR